MQSEDSAILEATRVKLSQSMRKNNNDYAFIDMDGTA
jgi:hypothetical protein